MALNIGVGTVRNPFFTYRLHARSEAFGTPRISGALGERRGFARVFRAPESALGDEDAARFHLQRLFGQETEAPLRTLLAEEKPQVLPDLSLRDVLDLRPTATRLVRFRQTYRSVTIFGSNVVVEIEPSGEFVSVTASLTSPPNISTMPTISAEQALGKIAEFTDRKLDELKGRISAPVHRLFHRRDRWHLTYLFSRVPAVPVEDLTEVRDPRGSNGETKLTGRAGRSAYDYFVDANTGEMIFYYSADPQLASVGKAIPPPTQLDGYDEDGVLQLMDGTSVGTEFEMSDPLRNIKTFDMNFKDAHPNNLPPNPIRSTSPRIGIPAAVSAHVNGTRVWNFYNSVLTRRSIDGKGMVLESAVNCLDSGKQIPPVWNNAVWADGRMWYGQSRDNNGNLRSLSRLLDVIAHELTHGVTEATAGLVYKNESGALNESISDIFGVIISNHALRSAASIQGWNWEIGAGLGRSGGPLRDFSDPTRTNDPDHMNRYVRTPQDSGGVHTNSNIHNKAAYNMLTTTDASGAAAFSPEESALLYYLGLTRLGQIAGFMEMRDALEYAATTRYAGRPIVQQQRIKDIRVAYEKVGVM